MHLRNARLQKKRGRPEVAGVPPSLSVSLAHGSPLPSFLQDPVCGLGSTLLCTHNGPPGSQFLSHPGWISINQSQLAILLNSDYFSQSAHRIPLLTIIGSEADT